MSSRYHDIAEAFARSLLGTPFHHAARVPGVGIDCVGVIVLTGTECGCWPIGFDVLPYPEFPTGFDMRDTCRQYLRPIRQDEMRNGDVVLLVTDKQPQHLGVVGRYKDTHHRSIIHASNVIDHPRVVETPLMFDRGFRFCESYRFPWPKS